MNDIAMPVKFGAGQPIRRFEDKRLLTGHGNYLDDVNFDGETFGYVFRSPVAHAAIKSLDVSAAQKAPGVVAVFTGADLDKMGVNNLPCGVPITNRDGTDRPTPVRPILASGKVRFAGEGIAFVIAETRAQANDAAELIEVEFDMLDAAANLRTATDPGQPQIHDDVPNNQLFDWGLGDKDATDAAFEKAAHVTRLDLINNRVTAHPMETRGAVADYDAASGKLTLYSSTQGGWGLKNQLAENFLKTDPANVRVITPDVGGGFGMKLFVYPEVLVTAIAAKEIERPVKWIADRSESFLADNAGRDHVTTAELALDADHKIQGLRVTTKANMGAYLSSFAPFIPTIAASKVITGVYDVHNLFNNVIGVMTNTCPVDAYRGAGRPESNYMIERLLDAAAREVGIGPDEIRRRNMIPSEAMPFTTAAGTPYDSGEFVRVMEACVEKSDWTGFEARKRASAAKGLRRGRGLAYYIEATVGGVENAAIRFGDDGFVRVYVGTQSNGQGHETGYTQLLNRRLGIPMDKVKVIQGDTDAIAKGGGTGGSRSLVAEGTALLSASDQVIERGKQFAADELETAVADIEFGEGAFRVVGTDKSVDIMTLAQKVASLGDLPEGMEDGLDRAAETEVEAGTFPNGCHICEVEIDPATGQVYVDRYTVVDDIGIIINPMIVEGQVHGGIGQGVGQALLEQHVYDASGQLLTGSLQDYALPKADDLCNYDFSYIEVPCKSNVMGVKGAGEAGAVGAPAAAINAVVDALADLGVKHVDMPATPEKLWQLMNK